MSYKTFFQRNDTTGYLAVYLGRDGEALAYGNGYDAQNSLDPNWSNDILIRNTIAHAYESAAWAANDNERVEGFDVRWAA